MTLNIDLLTNISKETNVMIRVNREKAFAVIKEVLDDGIANANTPEVKFKYLCLSIYTPFFNDGDECLYRSYTEAYDINDDEIYGSMFNAYPELQSAIRSITSEVLSYSDSYETLLGDFRYVWENGSSVIEEYTGHE